MDVVFVLKIHFINILRGGILLLRVTEGGTKLIHYHIVWLVISDPGVTKHIYAIHVFIKPRYLRFIF